MPCSKNIRPIIMMLGGARAWQVSLHSRNRMPNKQHNQCTSIKLLGILDLQKKKSYNTMRDLAVITFSNACPKDVKESELCVSNINKK